MNRYVDELFYFYPEKHGYDPDNINQVHIIGEFNDWGINSKKLNDYKLIKDKTGRWLGLFKVPKGRGSYKFLLNRELYCPYMGQLFYSTASTPDWARKTIWYQIMVDRFYNADQSINPTNLISWDSPPDYFNNFGGDLRGIIEKISYLKDFFGALKDKAIYLNPLHKSLSSNHKYWPEDFNAIDPQFGSEEDFQNLIDSIHNEGGKLIIDLVYNHIGLNHYAFLDILKNGNNSIYVNWLRELPSIPHEKIEIPILEKYVGDKPQNIKIENDPRRKDFDSEKESFISIWDGKYKFPINDPEKFKNSSIEEILNNQPYYKLINLYSKPNYACWWDLFEIPALNGRSPEVRRHLFDVSRKWIRMGIDGFRLDVPNCLNSAHEFWAEFRQEMRQEASLNNKNPDDIYIVGEIWHGGETTNSYLYADANSHPVRFDAIMNYPIRENVLNFLSGDLLVYAFDKVTGPGEISVSEMDKNLHENLGYMSWGTDQTQYNVFSSHDSRRLRTALKDNDKKLKAALSMEFTLPGAPTIYYGDEIGLKGADDPACRETMKWNVVNNLSQYPDRKSIFAFYKSLIKMREDSKALIDGLMLTLLCDNHDKVYAYARYHEDETFIVVIVRDVIHHDLVIDISSMPFENIINWQSPITGKNYINYGQGITIKPEDFADSSGLIIKNCID